MIAPYAVTAQIKTSIAGKPADLPRVVGILSAINYRGWLALEYEDGEEPTIQMFAPLTSSMPSATRFPSGEARRTSYAPEGTFEFFDDPRPVDEREIFARTNWRSDLEGTRASRSRPWRRHRAGL